MIIKWALGLLLALVLILVVVLFAFLFAIWWQIPVGPSASAERALANQMGVRITDYSLPMLFPVGYYRDTLQTSMSVADVHARVQLYKRVMYCGDHREVYYYYSTNERTTRRFEIWYADGHLDEVRGEDTNSHTIRTEDCEVGLLPEN